MTKITHDNAVRELLKDIPELRGRRQFDDDELNSPTIVFDEFGDFILDRILSQPPEDSVIKKSFDFINKMMISDDPHTQNLPVIGVFEVLAGSKKGLEVGRKLLNEKGKYWLNRISKNFRAQ